MKPFSLFKSDNSICITTFYGDLLSMNYDDDDDVDHLGTKVSSYTVIAIFYFKIFFIKMSMGTAKTNYNILN